MLLYNIVVAFHFVVTKLHIPHKTIQVFIHNYLPNVSICSLVRSRFRLRHYRKTVFVRYTYAGQPTTYTLCADAAKAPDKYTRSTTYVNMP